MHWGPTRDRLAKMGRRAEEFATLFPLGEN